MYTRARRPLRLLAAVLLLTGCGPLGLGGYDSLTGTVEQCVDATLSGLGETVSNGARGSSAASSQDWVVRVDLPEAEVGAALAALRERLVTEFEASGASIHGVGLSGSPGSLVGFELGYTSADEEGLVWVRRITQREGRSLVVVVFHGVSR